MIEQIWQFFVNIFQWFIGLFRQDPEPPPPPPPPPAPNPMPFYFAEMRKSHPGITDDELQQWGYFEAINPTNYWTPQVLANGHIYKNNQGEFVLQKMKDQDIAAGGVVFCYLTPFEVDGSGINGNHVYESVFHPDSKVKGLAPVKDFKRR